MSKVVYIVLTETGTLLSRAIQLYTQEDYNHVSIAFDADLNDMYSFGRKFENNPFIGGFIKESIQSKWLRESNCAIYECPLTDEQYKSLKQKIYHYQLHMEKYRYNFIGLIGIACHIKLERQHAFFCSQFIATLFQEIGLSLDGRCPYFTKPADFSKLPYLHLCYTGKLSNFTLIPADGPHPNIPIHAIKSLSRI